MPNWLDLCDLAPQESELRSLVSTFYKTVPAWKNEYIKCDDIDFHDICVKDVLLLFEKPIDFHLRLPSRDEFPDNTIFQPEQSYVVVRCTNVNLKGCSAVHMKVKYDVIVEGVATNTKRGQKCYLVWELEEENTIRTFYTFKDWNPVTGNDLSSYLRQVDGSSIIVDLNCGIDDGYVHVSGTIADKLWKEENLVVLAAKPYNGIAARHKFPETEIPSCDYY